MMVLTCSKKILKNQEEFAENNDKRKQHRSELDNTKILSGTQKVKFGRDFLGCVESSTHRLVAAEGFARNYPSSRSFVL
jgi:hypothetical protein